MQLITREDGLPTFIIHHSSSPCFHGSHVIALSFLCPVRCKSDFTTASPGSGIVLYTFEKSASWPLTAAERAGRMVVMDKLPKWREGDEALVYTIGHQFTVQEKLVMGGHVPVPDVSNARGSFLFHHRNAVKVVMECHNFEFVDESILVPCLLETMTQEEARTVYIRGKKGMKRDGAGRPVMELVFETRLYAEMLEGLLQGRWGPSIPGFQCVMAFTNLLHEVLVRNSHRAVAVAKANCAEISGLHSLLSHKLG